MRARLSPLSPHNHRLIAPDPALALILHKRHLLPQLDKARRAHPLGTWRLDGVDDQVQRPQPGRVVGDALLKRLRLLHAILALPAAAAQLPGSQHAADRLDDVAVVRRLQLDRAPHQLLDAVLRVLGRVRVEALRREGLRAARGVDEQGRVRIVSEEFGARGGGEGERGRVQQGDEGDGRGDEVHVEEVELRYVLDLQGGCGEKNCAQYELVKMGVLAGQTMGKKGDALTYQRH